ncbi:Os09g0408966 [Oryza sativa Japonica Group]|uniref:Os09g0408966 protein n=1 Tax=Oryza sativa subsp. japonica TaxID=39947 RepID=A0A0P0XNG1_ORYSJ|nr:hypothetical protein EE612_047764 [Oryza sativa]BAT08032.1 Os09g0408966 [Oryza sativa Japonica Group]
MDKCTVQPLSSSFFNSTPLSSRCKGSPWLRMVWVLDVVVVMALDAADVVACDAVVDVDGELVPDVDPTEKWEPPPPPRVPYDLRRYRDPGTPGRVGSSSVLCFLDRMITTRFMSGLIRGSACTHSSPIRTSSSTCSVAAADFTAGSSSSMLLPFLYSLHACPHEANPSP